MPSGEYGGTNHYIQHDKVKYLNVRKFMICPIGYNNIPEQLRIVTNPGSILQLEFNPFIRIECWKKKNPESS